MGRPAAWVLARVPAAEFDWWAAYFTLNPFGPRQDDLRAGTVAAAVANAFGGGKARLQPADFFPSLAPPRPAGHAAMRSWLLSRDPSRTPIRYK